MPLESATYISDLDPSNPVGSSDLVSSLDDHMRLVKATLQTTFPGIAGAVTATHTELNFLDGVTGTTGTGQLVLDDTPTIADLTVTDSITLPAASVADAALSANIPKLDAAAATFSGRITFAGLTSTTNGSSIVLQSTSPGITIVETDAGEDEKAWTLARPVNGVLNFYAATDAQIASSAGLFMSVERSGTAITEVELNATTLDFNGEVDISGNANVLRLRTAQGSDASLSSTNHPLQLGPSDGPNLIADINEIMARNNGAAADIAINTNGGDVILGHSSSTVSVPGTFLAGTAATSTSTTLAPGRVHHVTSGPTIGTAAAGNWVGVYNNSASPITLTQGSGLTLRLAGTSLTGNRTLAARGLAVVYWPASSTAVVSGGGVT